MIIFGSKSKISIVKSEEALKKACVNCKGNLNLAQLKKWFTLYFIPVFPYQTVDTFYHCDDCSSTYKKEFKELMKQSKSEVKKYNDNIQKTYVTTLAVCMAHMSKIDGTISKSEEKELNNLIKGFPKFEKDIKSMINSVKNTKDNSFVFSILDTTSKFLTIEARMNLLASVARVIIADGKILPSEKKLMLKYMKIMDCPENIYPMIIERVKSNN